MTQITAVSKAAGGCVPNVAIDLKKIAPELNVTAIGRIGRDENGRFVKKILKDNGVNADTVIEYDGDLTSFTQVISVSGGQRTFFTFPGASAHFGADDVDFSKLDAGLLHLGYFLLLDKIDAGDGLKILKAAKDAGLMTSVDLVSEDSDRYRLVLPCLPYTDYLIVNEIESARLADLSPDTENVPAAAKKLISAGVREKVIVHFRDGAVCACADGSFSSLGSFDLPGGYRKGTTGAGDAFCAGALYAISEGLPDEAILEYGISCATLALSAPDATSGLADIGTALARTGSFERKNTHL